MPRGDGTKKIGNLFEKYRRTLRAPQKTVIISFHEVVRELLDIEIDEKRVRYSPGSRTLSISGGGPLKSEVQLHKDDILAHLKGRLGEHNAPKEIL